MAQCETLFVNPICILNDSRSRIFSLTVVMKYLRKNSVYFNNDSDESIHIRYYFLVNFMFLLFVFLTAHLRTSALCDNTNCYDILIK